MTVSIADLGSAPLTGDAARSLTGLPTATLVAAARDVRDAAFGTRVTFSPKVFLPLTKLCADRCGYCTFATAPRHLPHAYLTPDEVLAVAGQGANHGCAEALFTLGEGPERRYPEARAWLDEHGYTCTVDYLVAMARAGAHRDRPAAARQCRRHLPRRTGPTADGRAQSGDDDRVAAARSGRAPRRPGQDPAAPAGHAARRR